jgi:hypothetical protein
MVVYSIPKEIEDTGEVLVHAGDGSTRGSQAFRTRTGRLREYFVGKVLSTGQHFARLKVLGNEMEDVSLDRPPAWLREGHVVLLKAPYREGPRSKTAHVWPVKVKEKETVRVAGTIHTVTSPLFGFARSDKGREVRVNVEKLQAGARLQVGARITYVELLGERGFYAADVRAVRDDNFELSLD